jgi:hypothetical protein
MSTRLMEIYYANQNNRGWIYVENKSIWIG